MTSGRLTLCADAHIPLSKGLGMNVGLFALRVVVGSLFAAHGSQKLFGWFGGFGIRGTGGYMESVGLRPGGLMAGAAGASELVGGSLLGIGLLVPFAATVLAGTMVVAARTDHRGKGLWIYNSGYEYVLTNAVIVVALSFNGAGSWSVDAAIGWHLAGLVWGIGASVVALLGAVVVLGVFGARAKTVAETSTS